MQTLRVNGYDIAYLELGHGPPLVCVHGTLGDFRTWFSLLGPLSKKHRVISVSLRHFYPEHWNGVGDDYRMAQNVADVDEVFLHITSLAKANRLKRLWLAPFTMHRQLIDAIHIDRLNLGPIPTIKLNWLQPHEGSIVDFLFRARAFQFEGTVPE